MEPERSMPARRRLSANARRRIVLAGTAISILVAVASTIDFAEHGRRTRPVIITLVASWASTIVGAISSWRTARRM